MPTPTFSSWVGFCVDGLCLTCIGDSLYDGVRFVQLKPSLSSESQPLPYL
jgi:hypothetical protein